MDFDNLSLLQCTCLFWCLQLHNNFGYTVEESCIIVTDCINLFIDRFGGDSNAN